MSAPAILTLSVSETAKLLGVSRNGAYEAIAKGELPSIRVGRRLLVPRVALERMLDVEVPTRNVQGGWKREGPCQQ
jgi:excisionase family DNA binding protein